MKPSLRPCKGCSKPTTSKYGYCESTRACLKARNHATYLALRASIIARSRAADAQHRAWLRSLKIGKSCVDCELECTGVNYPAFDWDHRPGVKKLFCIGRSGSYYSSEASRQRILSEIAKCDLRCRNCHAIVTHQRRNVS